MRLITILLDIYIWGAVCILLFFLFRIARFYQKKSGRRVYYSAYLVSVAFFSLAAIRYMFLTPVIGGDTWGDGLRFVASLILAGFGLFLLNLMTGSRSQSR